MRQSVTWDLSTLSDPAKPTHHLTPGPLPALLRSLSKMSPTEMHQFSPLTALYPYPIIAHITICFVSIFIRVCLSPTRLWRLLDQCCNLFIYIIPYGLAHSLALRKLRNEFDYLSLSSIMSEIHTHNWPPTQDKNPVWGLWYLPAQAMAFPCLI